MMIANILAPLLLLISSPIETAKLSTQPAPKFDKIIVQQFGKIKLSLSTRFCVTYSIDQAAAAKISALGEPMNDDIRDFLLQQSTDHVREIVSKIGFSPYFTDNQSLPRFIPIKFERDRNICAGKSFIIVEQSLVSLPGSFSYRVSVSLLTPSGRVTAFIDRARTRFKAESISKPLNERSSYELENDWEVASDLYILRRTAFERLKGGVK